MFKQIFPILAATLALTGTAAMATDYDGIFRPSIAAAANWNCRDLGMDGGALAIQGNRFIGVENACTLEKPININGMEATIYNASCSGEGESYSLRMILMKHDRGIYVITDGQIADWVYCTK